MNFLNKINQQGDTLVEVLICIVIIGIILSGGYVTANQSFNSELSAQEHTDAAQIAISQIESLRGVVSNDLLYNIPFSVPVMPPDNTFCIFTNSTTSLRVITPASYPSCDFSGSGLPDNTTLEPIYTVKIIYTDNQISGSNALNPLFTVKVKWDNATSESQQEIFYYRLYTS